MTELIQDIIKSLKGRLKNPFTGAFIISLITYNWRPIAIILFSPEHMEHRIHYIKHVYPSSEFYTHILIPLFFSIAYIVMLPWITIGLNKLTKTSTIEKRKIETENYVADRKSERTKAQSDFDLEQVKNGFKNQEELNLKIENLKETIRTLEKSAINYNLERKNLNSELETQRTDSAKYRHLLNIEREKGINETMNLPKLSETLTNELKEALIKAASHQGEPHPVYSIINKKLTDELIEEDLIEELFNEGSGNASMELTLLGVELIGELQNELN